MKLPITNVVYEQQHQAGSTWSSTTYNVDSSDISINLNSYEFTEMINRIVDQRVEEIVKTINHNYSYQIYAGVLSYFSKDFKSSENRAVEQMLKVLAIPIEELGVMLTSQEQDQREKATLISATQQNIAKIINNSKGEEISGLF